MKMIIPILFFSILLAGAARPIQAAETGIYLAVLTRSKFMVFTPEYLAERKPKPGFSDFMLTVSAYEPRKYEFNVFAHFISGKQVYIDNGFYDTKKTNLGAALGKILSIPLLIPGTDINGQLDISAGPFFSFYLGNNYTFLSGTNKKEVTDNFGHRFQYGLYSTVKLQALYLKRFLRQVNLNIGLTFQLPFSNHDYNSDEKARFHLFRTFFFTGISF